MKNYGKTVIAEDEEEELFSCKVDAFLGVKVIYHWSYGVPYLNC